MAPINTADNTGFVGSLPSPTLRKPSVTRSVSQLRASMPLLTLSAQAIPSRTASTVTAPTLLTSFQPARSSNFFNAPAPGAGLRGTSLVLFRSDLRLDDHAALTKALETSANVIPVFCFDPRHFGRTPHGFDKTGKYRARFLLDSVRALREQLVSKGSNLVVRLGKPEDVVSNLALQTGADRVFLHSEVTYEDQQVERDLRKAVDERCGANKVAIETMWSNTLYHRDDMPFPLAQMPDVYSDFREALERNSKIQEPLPAPKKVPALPKQVELGDIPTLSQLGITEHPRAKHAHHVAASGTAAVRGGEKEALSRVAAYVRDTHQADARRAFRKTSKSGISAHANVGADFSCRISPWLALGCVSPRRIFHEMKKATNDPMQLTRSSTYFELVWRDFFRFITSKYSEKRAVSAGKAGKTPVATSLARA